MKKLRIIVAALLTVGLSLVSFAQQTQQSNVPQAIKYQAVARDVNGNAIANQPVSFRISIIEGSENGTAVYEETQTATTNQFGLANLSIGKGTVISGQFDSIKWGNGTFFAKIEFDPKGGSDYTYMGSSQMLSVPYALYAANAGNMPTFPVKAALIGTNLQAPFDSPQTGMLVYNTDSSGIAPYNVVPGYYYNAGTPTDPDWIMLSTESNSNSTLRPTHDACSATLFNAFGCSAGNGTLSGSNCTGYGYGALRLLTTGNQNTAIGSSALGGITTGQDNTGVGAFALTNINSAANYNTALGWSALDGNSGFYNVGLGYNSMGGYCAGSSNTGVGSNSLLDISSGSFNTAVGDSALSSNTSGTDNVAEGYQALTKNTTGTGNTANGYEALYANTTAGNNTALGDQALYANTTAGNNTALGDQALYTQNYSNSNTAWNSFNVAVGYQSLYSNQPTSTTTGVDNTAIGSLALYDNTTGAMNTATGSGALAENTTGSSNTSNGAFSMGISSKGSWNSAFGDSALYDNTKGNYNSATGYGALTSNTTSGQNVAVGYEALFTQSYSNSNAVWDAYNVAVGAEALYSNQPTSTSNGYENTAIGDYALYFNTTGYYNNAMGVNALRGNTTASANVAIGNGALYTQSYSNSSTVWGSYNVAVGIDALYSNQPTSTTTGYENTAVGYNALNNNVTGSTNTAIGYSADVNATNLTNATAVGANAKVCASNTMMFGDGNVNQWNYGWSCSSTCSAGVINVHTSAGTVSMSASGAWSLCSDHNKKKNFTIVDGEDLLNKIAAIPITRWNYKWDSSNVQHIGPMAQDFYKAFKLNNDSLTISTIDEPGVALAGVQALNKKLESENAVLKNQISEITKAQTLLNAQQTSSIDDAKRQIAELKKLVNSMIEAQASIKK